jgi:LysR family glycine cleavage system transcriptional activator
LAAEKLMEEEVYPVCSPQLLIDHWRLQKPADLAQEMLIHDLSMDSHTDFPTWHAWFKCAGLPEGGSSRGMKINNSAAVLQAAIEGHGIALARSVMAHNDLASGRLVRLFPEISFQSPLAYYAVYRPECSTLPGLKRFRDWLFSEANDPASK